MKEKTVKKKCRNKYAKLYNEQMTRKWNFQVVLLGMWAIIYIISLFSSKTFLENVSKRDAGVGINTHSRCDGILSAVGWVETLPTGQNLARHFFSVFSYVECCFGDIQHRRGRMEDNGPQKGLTRKGKRVGEGISLSACAIKQSDHRSNFQCVEIQQRTSIS